MVFGQASGCVGIVQAATGGRRVQEKHNLVILFGSKHKYFAVGINSKFPDTRNNIVSVVLDSVHIALHHGVNARSTQINAGVISKNTDTLGSGCKTAEFSFKVYLVSSACRGKAAGPAASKGNKISLPKTEVLKQVWFNPQFLPGAVKNYPL